MLDADPHLKIDVFPEASYLPQYSEPEQGRFTFAYRIRIVNSSPVNVQLLERHWIINDTDNGLQEVRGEGVVGEQPVISASGGVLEYTSSVILATPVGAMKGNYRMVTSDGTEFKIAIPEFTLRGPVVLH